MKQQPQTHKRVIVDYAKLTQDILDMLVTKYPHGYQDRDIIRFKNAQNETIEAVEVRTEDTIYLVKVSKRLANTMEEYEDDFDDDDDRDDDSDETDIDFDEVDESTED